MRRIALSFFALSAAAAFAGNMTLTIGTLPAVQLTGFSTGATNPVSFSGGGGGSTGKAIFKEFSFKAAQSSATPTLMNNLSQGRHVASAKVQVRTPDGARLVSEWTLTNVLVTAVDVFNGDADPKARGPAFFLAPETLFSLQFTKYCYKVFAADGTTIASEMCWDLATNTGA